MVRMIKKDYYSEIAEGYDELYREEQLKKLALLNNFFKPAPLLLDLGCGTGFALNFFKIKGVGVDPSFGLLRKNNSLKVCAKAEFLPFKDKTFNSLIALTSVHNFDDVNKAVKEIKRVCKENSSLAFTVLKNSKNFVNIVKTLTENFKLEILEEEKDLILVKHAK